jgi:hypothetical protein
MPIAQRSTTQPSEPHPLNERQRICLQIIAEMDRENERRFGQEWDRAENGEPPPPEAWRWLQYDPSHTVSEPELKRRLRQAGIGGGGIKATMKALWMRAHPVDAGASCGCATVFTSGTSSSATSLRSVQALPGLVGAVDRDRAQVGAAKLAVVEKG